jgi:heme iron utilization protein
MPNDGRKDMPDPVRPADDAARDIVRTLLAQSRTAALAFVHPETGAPFISRIAVACTSVGLVTLISDLSIHSRAIRASPPAGLLIGDLPNRGDPLNAPRVSLSVVAEPTDPAMRPKLRAEWLAVHPKAKLYVDFQDFRFVRFEILSAALNGGFGRAFALTAGDIILP